MSAVRPFPSDVPMQIQLQDFSHFYLNNLPIEKSEKMIKNLDNTDDPA